MNVAELFPPCHIGDCPQAGTPHHHVLPHQQELLDSTERIVALVGGYGSAKTAAMCAMGHLLSTSIRGNMGIVIRRSLPKLRDSTQRIYLEILDRAKTDVEFREVRDGWPGRIIYRETGSETVFRESKDLGRFLGPEYGWFGADEAQEEPEKVLKDLMGRLRLPRASRYLKGMLCTNPPRKGHWLEKWFPQPGTWTRETDVAGKLVKITFRMIRSKTGDNPFLDPEYIAQLKLTHTAEELRGILSGEYRTDYDGKPVYKPPFSHVWHVGQFPTKLMTVARSWDFGYHHPAVTFSQMYKCPKGSTHLTLLREYLPEDLEAEDLADGVLERSKLWFPEHSPSLFVDCGDSAGAAVSDKGPGPIIRLQQPPWGLRFRYQHVRDVDPGIAEVRKLLRTKCACGHFLLEVDRECPEVIEMLNGGYHYPKDRSGALKVDAKPAKDGYYDNIADSVRYAVWVLYRVARQDDGFMAELERWQGPPEDANELPNIFGWMGDWVGGEVDPNVLEQAHDVARRTGLREE